MTAMVDERLLGHFGLSPQVEPLGEPLAIIFSKYFREYAERGKGGSTPSGRSPKGTPASSSSRGKRPMSPPTGTPPEVRPREPGPARWGPLLRAPLSL
ncbi:UNVERIFIED_CONTAM: hypothetical protein Sradi_3877500 [Sesamum radiatum]|uniref:Uncharacterized protein n=1 Tax=Sesamum radiatum TaxID=300843 RepID=A0AAW2Q2J6_SESRA